MPQCIPHAVSVEVEVPEGLVSGDAAHLLQAAGQVFSQWPHGYALNLSIHDNGAGCQTLRTKHNTQWAQEIHIYAIIF